MYFFAGKKNHMNYSSGLGLAITTINFDNKCIFPLGKTFFLLGKVHIFFKLIWICHHDNQFG